MLKAPSFSDVYGWRLEQEHKLLNCKGPGVGTFDSQKLLRFISHFERITRHNLIHLPERVDALFTLDKARGVSAMKLRSNSSSIK
ncbi:hypothetical protein [Pseudoalteromonas sp. NEC-BIFX-2020_015]|uniref:hypothetical protein n=1 Tax=Pseudoalteromonas sp. NEC-BIFX-2020_015 TaxID=2729544 RepID=UPI001BAD5585|nr:hypothetical protein [Pseudoalteromonas sp. NEC-BIFX-2020_015]